MDISDIFAKSDIFTTPVSINIPGDGKDQAFRPTVKFRYLTQKQLDELRNEDSAGTEIDGELVERGDDAALLDKVLVGWTGWKVKGEEIEYSEVNHAHALNHVPIRTPMIMAFFARLAGGEGGKKGRRGN